MGEIKAAATVSCMVDAARVEEAVQALHGAFGLAEV